MSTASPGPAPRTARVSLPLARRRAVHAIALVALLLSAALATAPVRASDPTEAPNLVQRYEPSTGSLVGDEPVTQTPYDLTFTNLSGNFTSGATFTLVGPDGAATGSASAYSDGASPGAYNVTFAAWRASFAGNHTLQADGLAGVRLQVLPAWTLNVTVTPDTFEGNSTISYTVRVTSLVNGTPVAGARVTLPGGNVGTTNETGEYSYAGPAPAAGTHEIAAALDDGATAEPDRRGVGFLTIVAPPVCEDGEVCTPPSLALEIAYGSIDQCDPHNSVRVHLNTTEANLTVALRGPDGVVDVVFDGLAWGPTTPVYLSMGTRPYGAYVVEARAWNALGESNATTTFAYVEYADATPPQSYASLNWDTAREGGVYPAPLQVLVHASDDCAVATTRAWLDGAAQPTSFTIYQDGRYALAHQAVDINGNAGKNRTVNFSVDTRPPVVDIARPAKGDVLVADQVVLKRDHREDALVVGPVRLVANASDAGAGVVRVAWLVDGEHVGDGEELLHVFAPGAHVVEAVAYDGAGRSTTSAPRIVRA